LEDEDPTEMAAVELIHPMDRTRRRTLAREDISGAERLLETVQEGGRRLVDSPDLDSMRRLRQADVDRLDPGVRRLLNPHIYHVSLSRRLSDLKRSLIKGAVGSDAQDARSN